jgi:hypothetical protein
MVSNPCQGRRLPHTRVEETVLLTPEEFRLLRDHIDRDRWKALATWPAVEPEEAAATGSDAASWCAAHPASWWSSSNGPSSRSTSTSCAALASGYRSPADKLMNFRGR